MSADETHEVTLDWVDGQTRTIDVHEDETVLAAAERRGVGLPYGCRTGACGTCVGRLLSIDGAGAEVGSDRTGEDGVDTDVAEDEIDTDVAEDEVDTDAEAIDVTDAFTYRREPRALKPHHRADGYILLCIATPRTDSRVAVGSRVQSELVDNPWR